MLLWMKFILFHYYLMTYFTIIKSVNQSSFDRIEIVYDTDFNDVDLIKFTELLRLVNPTDDANTHDVSKVGNLRRVSKNSKGDIQNAQLKHSRSGVPKKDVATSLINRKLAIRNPTIPCGNNQTLCDDYDEELECREGICQCPGDDCWIYNVKNIGFIFTCGICGQLGSECKTNECDPPGTCLSDKYCHCSIGEHYGSDPDICTVYTGPTSTTLFLAGLLFFLFIGLFALSYSFIVNYRSTGYVLWCRDPRWGRGRRTQSRRNETFGPPKSPAFTMDVINRNEELPVPIVSTTSTIDLKNSNVDKSTEPPEEGVTYINIESEDHAKSLQPPTVKKKMPDLFKLTASTLEIDTFAQVNDKNDLTVPDINKPEESAERKYHKPEESAKEIPVGSPIEDTSGMTMYYEEYESRL